MKNKIKNIIIIILIISLVIFFCWGIYYLLDFILNGAVVDWFDKNYMKTDYNYHPSTGIETYVNSPNWVKLKPLLLRIFIGSSIFWLIIIFLISYLTNKQKEKKTITKVSQKLKLYMNESLDASDIFSPSQAEISAQMTEIKSKLIHNEQILKEETAHRNDLIAYLAHDLKTPLTSIIGYLSILEENFDMPQKSQKKYIKVALEKSYRLEELINELFDIARFNAKEIILLKEQLNLNLMLEQIIDDFYPLLKKQDKKIKLNTKADMKIFADPDKLSRVFSNLIKNAIIYSFKKSTIIINVNKDEYNIIVEIINEGSQISKEKMNKLFEKFYRVDSSRTSKNGGSGLGLAIAKDIVELHKGTITAKSDEKITTFIVKLPIR